MDLKLYATEHQESATFYDWCCLNNIPAIHIPNEGKRTKSAGARLKRIGLSKGFPDFIIFVPNKKYHALMIEMKSANGKLSKEQINWIILLNQRGYLAEVSWGADQAIAITEKYLRNT